MLVSYVDLNRFSIGAGTYSSTAASDVISDTGTSFLGGPTAIVSNLARQVGATVRILYSDQENVSLVQRGRRDVLYAMHNDRATHPGHHHRHYAVQHPAE
jgi:hypothetical protein